MHRECCLLPAPRVRFERGGTELGRETHAYASGMKGFRFSAYSRRRVSEFLRVSAKTKEKSTELNRYQPLTLGHSHTNPTGNEQRGAVRNSITSEHGCCNTELKGVGERSRRSGRQGGG